MICSYFSFASSAEFNLFLKENAWWMALSVAILILGVVLLFLLLPPHKKKGKKEEPLKIESESSMKALGGKANVLGHQRKGHRIEIELQNAELVNKEALKAMGVSSFVLMSNKMTMVIQEDPEGVEKALFGE